MFQEHMLPNYMQVQNDTFLECEAGQNYILKTAKSFSLQEYRHKTDVRKILSGDWNFCIYTFSLHKDLSWQTRYAPTQILTLPSPHLLQVWPA
jgi:hypothetical protein